MPPRPLAPACRFLLQELGRLGWVPRNPARSRRGQVFARGECLADPRLRALLGDDAPDAVVKLSESEFYVIVARPTRAELDAAIEDAQERFAARINRGGDVSAKLVSGVAGDPADGVAVRSRVLIAGRFSPVLIRGEEMAGLLAPPVASHLIARGTDRADDVPFDESGLASAAEAINSVLHNGSIPATERARVIASLLLCVDSETFADPGQSPRDLLESINECVASRLRASGRSSFEPHLRIALPATRANHEKTRAALDECARILLALDLRSATRSGIDVLGPFFEAFLKYGNWARQSGIVLTPRHVTRFAASVLDVAPTDVVYDPTCGTGGFLVAAIDRARRYGAPNGPPDPPPTLIGIEQQPAVAALAAANMIFHDGRGAIVKESNCLHEWPAPRPEAEGCRHADRPPPITKVLMNPPFALKDDDEQEHKFVDHALARMQDGGLLFAILPDSELIREGAALLWRRDVLLAANTLRAVISLPIDLFYPVAGKHTCAIVVEKGVPHDFARDVLWVKVHDDGRVKRKRKRVAEEGRGDDLARSVDRVFAFLHRGTVPAPVRRFLKAAPIADPHRHLELVPEVHLDNRPRDREAIRAGIQEQLRGVLCFAILNGTFPFDRLTGPTEPCPSSPASPSRWRNARLEDLFELVNGSPAGSFRVSPRRTEGAIPLFRPTSNVVNLAAGWTERTPRTVGKVHPPGALLVSTDGEGSHTYAYIAPVAFIPNSNTAVLVPRKPMPLSFLLFVTTAIRDERWRFSYGRKPKGHRLRDLSLEVPARDDGGIDLLAFESMARSLPEYPLVLAYLDATPHPRCFPDVQPPVDPVS